MLISLDTETTGIDISFGAKPFLITTCDEEGNNTYWEWDVDPLTREPKIPTRDIREIKKVIREAAGIVFQHAKFDVKVLDTIGIKDWPWHKTHDTLIAGHLLASSQPHDLTTMTLIYTGVNIAKFEDDIEKYTKAALKEVKNQFPEWMIAKKGLACMPSAKEKVWKNDMWVMRCLAKKLKLEKDHPYWTVVSTYANGDSASTLKTFIEQKKQLETRNLWNIYSARMRVVPIATSMEMLGVTYNEASSNELEVAYKEVIDECAKTCVALSGGHLEEMPKGITNNLRHVIFEHFNLKTTRKTASGKQSLKVEVIDDWLVTLPRRSKAYTFIKSMADYRKRVKAVTDLQSYIRFSKPHPVYEDYRIIHPSLNPTGTNTLRWSSNNPNEQNISKQKGFNARYAFGPVPGRGWASFDYNNLELRIPAYECREPAMLELFEHPEKPPYFGSYHLLVFDILHPEKFAKYGADCKDVYKSTWYGWTKNGNFAELYGAVESSGTADRAFHVDGAQRKVAERLTEKTKLNKKWIKFANENGYVETMPDISVDPERGYPIECTRSKWGNIKPTVPLNYHVQGTACWIIMRAMIEVQAYLDQNELDDWFITMQIHDELVIDFPLDCDYKSHLLNIKTVMESIGDDVCVPLTCGCELNFDNWSEGVELTAV